MKLQLLIVFVLSFDKFPEKCHSAADNGKVLSITASTPEQVDILRNISTQFEASESKSPDKYLIQPFSKPAHLTVVRSQDYQIISDINCVTQTVLWQPASPFHITADTEVHLYVPQESVLNVTAQLESNQFTHSVMLENTEEHIELQTKNDTKDPRLGGPSFYERYHNLEEIYHWVNKTTKEHANRVTVLLIGSSFEKRPLYVLKISGKTSDTPKKAMWLDCGIHAREWISPAFCLWFVDKCINHYGLDREITEMMDSLDIYVLPMMNPDGYKHTWTTKRMWRKNRAIHPNGVCVGVDLNRNFDANWCTSGASSNPCEDTYCGQYPESEPEAQAVANFLRSHKDTVKLYVSIHSYSQMLLFPYSCAHELAPNHDELNEMAKDAAKDIQRYYRSYYKFGSGSKTIYLAPGGSDDWAYNLGIKYSFTFELQDRGRYGFLLPPNLIANACKESLLALKSISLKVIKRI